MASGLHGGIAGFQEVCGAFTGGVVALGYQISRQGRDYKDHKKTTDEAIRELAGRFRNQAGDLRCRGIVGYDFSDPEQFKAFRKSDVPKTKCRPMVEFVVKQVLATKDEGGVLPTR
jgi:C_GCAxxG_C_C family probable redox protein